MFLSNRPNELLYIFTLGIIFSPYITVNMQIKSIILTTLAIVVGTSAQQCGVVFGNNLALCQANCIGGQCDNIGGTAVLLFRCDCFGK